MLPRMPDGSSHVTSDRVRALGNGSDASAEHSGGPTSGATPDGSGAPARNDDPASVGGDTARGSRGHPDDGPAAPPGGGRYEALPGLTGLPGWIWRRLPRPAKVGVALLPLVVVGLVLALGPGIDEGKEKRASAEAERLAQARAERIERLRREQRPRFGAGEPAVASLAGRRELLDGTAAAVLADARARVDAGTLDGPIRRVECEPYPRTVGGRGAHENTSRRVGRYACLAVTSEIPASEVNEAGTIGHPYRMRIDFETGGYAFCKVSGRAGEGSIGTGPLVPVPRACGGK
jgi:hypothetical protein